MTKIAVNTASRSIEHDLRLSEERYHSLFKAMMEGFCLIELLYDDTGEPVNYRFLETNSAFELHSGFAAAAGKTILELVPDFEHEWFRAYHQVAITGEALNFESEFKSMNHWFDVSVTRADSAGCLSIVFKDISARKIAEEKLRQSEERFQSLFDSIDDGFCLVDVVFEGNKAVDYVYLQTNPAFNRQTGLIPAPGTTARQLMPHLEEYWFTSFGDAVRTGQPRRFVSEANPPGRTFDVHVNKIGDKNSTKAAVVFRDVTDKMYAEYELRKQATILSEADRQKNEFLATLAHELRGPLSPLINGLQLLELTASHPTASNIIGMMKRQLDNMVTMVNDLMDVARISSGKIELRKERSELRALVDGAVESCMPLIDSKHHTLTLSLPAEPIWLDVDPLRISQVISNLLCNAAKYTPAAGSIEISAWQENAEIQISITDTGVGIKQEVLAGVFDLFSQVSQSTDLAMGGLGIGLSLVRKLVELHGGVATAQSPGPGKGSTFSITLPRVESVSDFKWTPRAASVASAAPEPFRELVADDSYDTAKTLTAVSNTSGQTVKLAHH